MTCFSCLPHSGEAIIQMLKFENYSIETLKKYIPIIEKSPFSVNDVSTGSFFMWHKGVNLAFCLTEDGSFISKQEVSGEVAFSYPYGGDEIAACKELFDYCRENDLPLKFYGVSDELLTKLKNNPVFNKISYSYDRKWSDYIYDFSEMKTFSGKKFSGQRNHINKFGKLYPTAGFTPLLPADKPAVREFLKRYRAEHAIANLEETDEYKHTEELLDKFDEIGLFGGKFTLNGEVISFTIGEIQGDTLIIHIEKALKSVIGAYPATFNAFVNYAGEKYDFLRFVNREDDSGDAGLRTSKLQYNPIKLVNKNIVKVNSPYADVEIPTIIGKKVILSAITEADKANYLALCTDDDNNKYWGYDYREDEGITSEIDENTFYDIVAFDRAVGDSINFAVRDKDTGELIGETITYNATVNGKAETGCRIAKAFSGKGRGEEAFGLTADFAQSLSLTPTAKCYKQNEPSKKMIIACGFKFIREDETFFYFSR